MAAIEILPGESAQALHRDDSLYPIESPGMELQIGVMWALDDFTEENGGTRVVPGSHRNLRSWHLPNLSEWVSCEMPKGSALIWSATPSRATPERQYAACLPNRSWPRSCCGSGALP